MLLIGMFDSPFVRRIAITMKLLDLPFEHANWSVGRDFDRIREYNPLLFDFVLKRHLRSNGKALSNSVFETRKFFEAA